MSLLCWWSDVLLKIKLSTHSVCKAGNIVRAEYFLSLLVSARHHRPSCTGSHHSQSLPA